MSKLLGYCKECKGKIHESDSMAPQHPNLYECPSCGHPHTKDEITPPDDNSGDTNLGMLVTGIPGLGM
jgi:hypothetical protein